MIKQTTLFQSALRVVLVLSIVAPAFAQSTNGTIRGAVLDPSDALIPRALITVSSASGFSRTVKTSPAGTFEMLHLVPGTYSISINATGFRPALEDGIQVHKDRVPRENVKLGVSVNQVIEVFANDDPRRGARAVNCL